MQSRRWEAERDARNGFTAECRIGLTPAANADSLAAPAFCGRSSRPASSRDDCFRVNAEVRFGAGHASDAAIAIRESDRPDGARAGDA